MKRVALTLALMIGSAALVYGGSYLIGYYRSTWSAMYSLAYAEGNDTAAHKYAERLSLLDKQQAGLYLAQLDVTRSLRLQGAARRQALEQADKELVGTNFPDWLLGYRRDAVLIDAYLDTELGREAQALQKSVQACQTLRPVNMSFENCMQSIASETFGGRQDALISYEQSVLAMRLKLGDPVLARFYVLLAISYFNPAKAQALRDAMITDGVYTTRMQKRYCEGPARLNASICPTKQT